MNFLAVIEPSGDYASLNGKDPSCKSLVFDKALFFRCWRGSVVEAFQLVTELAGFDFIAARAEYFGAWQQDWGYVSKLLENGTVDSVVTVWVHSEERDKAFRFITPDFVSAQEKRQDFLYVVVEKSGEDGHGYEDIWEAVYFNNIFGVFEWPVWMCLVLFLLLLAVILVMKRFRRPVLSDFEEMAFSFYRILLAQADLAEIEVDKMSRMVLIIWQLIVVLFVATFSGMVFMATTIKPGWVAPFQSLVEMEAAGYKYVTGNEVNIGKISSRFFNNPYQFELPALNASLLSAGNHFLYNVFTNLMDSPYYPLFSDVENQRYEQISRLYNPSAPTSKTVYWYSYIEDERSDRNCNFHPLNLEIESKQGFISYFPSQFVTPNSIALSRKSGSKIAKFKAEYNKLFRFGIIRALHRLRIDEIGRNRSRNILTYRKCQLSRLTKIRAPGYDQAMGMIQDQATTFLCLVVGLVFASVLFTCELIARKFKGFSREAWEIEETRFKKQLLVSIIFSADKSSVDRMEKLLSSELLDNVLNK